MANKFDSIISEVIRREVGDAPDGGYTNDPKDAGGRTQYGISERSNPRAWADRKVTPEEAREIYFNKYVKGPGYANIPNSHAAVREQLIDFGVNSGPYIATQKVQAALGVKTDGVLGPKTLTALVNCDPRSINNTLVAERVKMLGKIISRNSSQSKFALGWLTRAVDFLS